MRGTEGSGGGGGGGYHYNAKMWTVAQGTVAQEMRHTIEKCKSKTM